ncbi:MAG: phosphatase PAP2 family protein [bacterium]|nr:phosphatase PAP2 family protein [bacterium]
MTVTPKDRYFYLWSWSDLLLGIYCLMAYLLVDSFASNFWMSLSANYVQDIFCLGIIFFSLTIVNIWVAWSAWRAGDDDRLFGGTWLAVMRSEYLTRQRFWDIIHYYLLFKVVLIVYGLIKQSIPLIHGQLFDDILLKQDIFFHLGRNPMLDMVHIFSGWADGYIDLAYVGWYPVLGSMMIVLLMQRDRRVMEWGIFSLLFLWMAGGLLALAVPSLGPVYVRSEWFAGLSVPHARMIQAQLWQHYQEIIAGAEATKFHNYEGIAAFPSLHVAIVALYSFVLWRINRISAWLMIAYTVVVQIGSVFLGWHYAIDGYIGIALAFVIAKTSERLFGVRQ